MAGLPRPSEKATWRSGLNNGKLGTTAQPRQPPLCPECGSSRVWKDGLRRTGTGVIQRYLCRTCSFRFSESTTDLQVKVDVPREILEPSNPGNDDVDLPAADGDPALEKIFDQPPFLRGKYVGPHDSSSTGSVPELLNILRIHNGERRVGAEEVEAKNLAEVEPQQERAGAGATTKSLSAEVKGKILEFSFWMLKEGYAEPTIKLRTEIIKTLVKRGADLRDPDSVKRTIALQKTWGDGRKANAVVAYTCFLAMEELTWKPPRYKWTAKLPFIPLESEIDQMVAGCGKKMSTYLQGLKETGADPGELWRVEWIDVDVEKRVVRINHPVKGHNPRILPISTKWISMLERLPKKSERIFGGGSRTSHIQSFMHQRRRLAVRLGNPRLMKICFTTLRHWKGTTEYHKTRDILHVKRILGHKDIKSTMVYINLKAALFQAANDEFHVKVAEDAEESRKLLEVGFEYVCTTPDNLMLFRKRK